MVELLLVLLVIFILGTLLFAAVAQARKTACATRCANQLRQITLAVHLYASDYQQALPRTSHSAFLYGQLPWSRALATYFGSAAATWTNLFEGVYRCPSKTGSGLWSYGMSVYFELSPDYDDYIGSPATWNRVEQVLHPTTTILLAEVPGSIDHLMVHFWTTPADATDVASTRHRGRANYAFVDGHVELLRFGQTYAPSEGKDMWNPSLAP